MISCAARSVSRSNHDRFPKRSRVISVECTVCANTPNVFHRRSPRQQKPDERQDDDDDNQRPARDLAQTARLLYDLHRSIDVRCYGSLARLLPERSYCLATERIATHAGPLSVCCVTVFFIPPATATYWTPPIS